MSDDFNAYVNTALQAMNFQANVNDSKWNKAFLDKQYNYNVALNQTMMDRDDNSVRRRLKDLTAAGFSPAALFGQVSAAGGSGNASTANASPLRPTPGNTNSNISAMAAAREQSRLFSAQVDLTAAEAARVRAETSRINADTAFEYLPRGMEESLISPTMSRAAERFAREMHLSANRSNEAATQSDINNAEAVIRQFYSQVAEEMSKAGLKSQQIDNQLKELDVSYVKATNMHRPTRDPRFGELQTLLSRKYGIHDDNVAKAIYYGEEALYRIMPSLGIRFNLPAKTP